MKERDLEYDANLERFAEAAAAMKISLARIEEMWERIRTILDDMQKVDELIDQVWPNSRMIDR